MADKESKFNIFGATTKKDIKVGYISTDRGYVQLVDLCEANRYAKYNPGTTFIYENRDKVLYLDINDVNDLDPSILLPNSTSADGGCGGLQLESPCNNKTVANFYGGGGVGVLGNPVIGTDGAVLAVDLVEGGFGYQYPPIVEVKNGCDIGDGSLFESIISDDGYTINTVKYYDECPGLEDNLELCDESPVEKAGWGRMFNQEGVDTGPWDPTKYTDNILANPIDLEMEAYKKALAEFKNPFWTSRSNTAITITSDDKVSKTKYDVYGWWWGSNPKVNPRGEIDNLYIKLFGRRGEPTGIEYWENDRVYGSSLARIEQGMKLQPEWKQVCEGECKPNMPECTYLFGSYWEYDKENFMNKYAISPEPMSNVLGTDGGGKMYSMEWDIDFPYDGNYTFIVQCDNEGTLFVDGKKQNQYNIGAGGAKGNTLSPPTKTMVKMNKGKHPVRFDLVNLMKKKRVVKPDDSIAKTDEVDFKIATSTYHGATASIEGLDIYHEIKFGGEYVAPKDFNRKVEYGRIYDVVLTSNTFRTAKTGTTNEITYIGLKRPGDKRWSSDTRLEFDDNSPNGFDVNGSFTIDNVVGGTAKFNKSGESIDFTGKNVKVTLTYTWKDNPNIAGKALDQIKMGNVTWTQGIGDDSNGEFKYIKPDGTLSITNGKQNPWIKSYQNDTNWVNNLNVGFLRDYAVFPVHDGTQNDKWHEGTWYLDIKTGGNYRLEVMSDDQAKFHWDENTLGKTHWQDFQGQPPLMGNPRVFVVNNVTVGKHRLKGNILNNGRYGESWYNNPGGIAWVLKDPSGTIVATSLDPFNDPGYSLRQSQGSETHTITLGGVTDLGSDETPNIELRTKGERVLQMEDIPHVPIEDQKILFDDVVMTASQGKFFGINGNKAKYTLDAPLPVDRSSSGGTGDELKIFDTLSFIDKASRQLWKTNNLSPQARKDSSNSFSNRYGITPFNPTIKHDSNYPGVHTIVWTNVKFPITTEYDITIAVDDNVRLRIGDQVDIQKDGFAVRGDWRTATGTTVYRKKVNEGTYTLTAELEQIPGGKYGMNANSMLLAIDIRALGSIETVVEKNSWNGNPFAVALSIESPPPPPPIREIPDDSDGQCPTNPIWSTMTPGSSESWYPVEHKPWSEFTNKYALSPVPPLDTPGSDSVGVVYKNSWKMDAPYGGYYTLKGTVEDVGKLTVNGKEITALASPTQICKKIQSTKVYLSEGTHDIEIQVENKKDYETPKFFIDQKIFNTQDWQNQVSRASGRTKDIDFKIATSTYHGATASIEALGIYHEKPFGGEYDPPKDFKRTVEYGRIYDVVLTSNTFRSITSGSGEITFVGMRLPENKRRSSDTRLEFDDNPTNGFDVNGSFTIDNVTGGTAKFSQSGDNIDITGKNVKVTLTYAWSDNPNIAGKALDQIKIAGTTWTQGNEIIIPKHRKQNPWIKSYQNDTNWVTNPRTVFLRDYAVFPVHDGTQNDKWHTGIWTVNITTPGNYRLEVMSDDVAKIHWDGDQIGQTAWNQFQVPPLLGNPRIFHLTGVTGGTYELKGDILNNGKFGESWYNNPGGLAWALKDPSGTIVATSLDPFNDPIPPSNRAAGSETHTITLGASTDLGDDMTSGIELRTKGERVLQMEDIPHVPIEDQKILFDDVIITVSEGKFFGINGNKAKYVLPELHNTHLDRGGVTYKGPALYNYKFKGYGEFLNRCGVSPDYPKFGGGELVNYEWSNIDFPKSGEYDFHFAHDAHGSVYLDGEEVIKGDFDNVAGVSAQDSANWDPGIKRKIKITKGKHTITVAPSDGRIGQREGWADGLFKKISDDYYRGQKAFDDNASALALGITIKTETKPEFGSKEEIAQRGKSWKDNPTAISAIMIPPPCPKKLKGKGVVVDVIVDDPGGPYPTPEEPPEVSYPVSLRLKKVVCDPPGINYDSGDEPIVFPPYIDPPPPPPPFTETPPPSTPPTTVTITGEPPTIRRGKCSLLRYTSFGNSKVVITPTVGEVPAVSEGTVRVCPDKTTTYTITGYPGDGGDGGGPTDTTTITVIDGGDSDPPLPPPTGDEIKIDPPNGAKLKPIFGPHGTVVGVEILDPGLGWTSYPTISMPSDTGIGVVFKPQFEIVRDPLGVPPDKLIQVTDLVGLKQTGYVDGRAYYGAVFFDNDIKYAGMYDTIGQKIRVYDTLQDSIDAMDRSDPSAIQRAGTDISSNDPRLDIPNTPDNLI